jgi:hypothetical protein
LLLNDSCFLQSVSDDGEVVTVKYAEALADGELSAWKIVAGCGYRTGHWLWVQNRSLVVGTEEVSVVHKQFNKFTDSVLLLLSKLLSAVCMLTQMVVGSTTHEVVVNDGILIMYVQPPKKTAGQHQR